MVTHTVSRRTSAAQQKRSRQIAWLRSQSPVRQHRCFDSASTDTGSVDVCKTKAGMDRNEMKMTDEIMLPQGLE